jgi:DNA-binding NarL/FixJ family response regulator
MTTAGIERTPTEAGTAENGAKTIRVFLADDHVVVRAGLRTLIDGQPDLAVVGEADDGQTAIERIAALQPPEGPGVDVALLDVSMPNGGGAEATAKVTKSWPETRVVALTMHEDKSYLRSLLEAGAAGYVLKRSASEELIRAIHTVAEGGTYLDPNLSAAVAESLTRGGSARASLRGEMQGATLSEREEEVLKLIAQGYTNKEIGVKLFLSVKTVETYKARSMEKLEMSGRADIVRYALAQGWLREVP